MKLFMGCQKLGRGLSFRGNCNTAFFRNQGSFDPYGATLRYASRNEISIFEL